MPGLFSCSGLTALPSPSQVALEELQDLKGVWSELSKVWEQIDQMKEQPWVSVQPRKVSPEVNVCDSVCVLAVTERAWQVPKLSLVPYVWLLWFIEIESLF